MSETPTIGTDGPHTVFLRLAGAAFAVQGLIFVVLSVLITTNTEFFEPHGDIDWTTFLTDLDASSTSFLAIKALMLALRTLYGISIVGMAVVWWSHHRTAAVLVVSFILVSIPVINVAQLMGMALVPLAGDHAIAVAAGDTAAVASIEASASTIYVIAEYLDTFVNVVPFVALLGAMFWLSMHVEGLERVKWILPLLMVLPFNKFLGGVEIISLLAPLLNVVATGAYFFLMARFMLRPVDRAGS